MEARSYGTYGKYRRILVPLDGSALGERALSFACRLVEQHGAELVLVRVVEPHAPSLGPTAPHSAGRRDAVTDQHSAVGAAQLYLEELASRLSVRRPIDTAVYYGDPVEGLLEEIGLRRTDLVVMATHGRTGLRVVLGSVADAVARRSPVPVLLIPPECARFWGGPEEDSGRPLTILAPLDGSPLAEAALPALEQLVRGAGARVTLYGVVQLVPTLYSVNGQAGQMQDAGDEIDALETYLARQAARLSRVADVCTQVEFGPPARRIAEHARAFDVDLVVMATHGRGGLSRLLMGSVASSVLHQLEVPLLLVRAAGLAERAADPRTAQTPRLVTAPAT